MPNKESAVKRMRQNEKRAERNKATKSKLKTAIKSVLTAVETKDVEAAKAKLPEVISVIGKTAKKGVIHQGNAARKQSRLTKKVNDLIKNAK